MAEIKVEPKRGGLGWLWAIIILALIAAALWYFFSNARTAPATATPSDSARTSMIEWAPVAVPSLLAWGAANG